MLSCFLSRRKILLSVFVLAVLVACATSPTGRNQLMMVGDAEMASMGQQLFAQMQQKTPPVNDARVNGEVNCVVHALVAELPATMRSGWEFRVFDDKTPNAFALPGKKIGVHSGMLKLVQNDDQLAAVIGHEIGHVLARHANERASMGMLAQITQEVAGQIGPGTAAVFGLGAQVGVMLPYSRTHEAEADVIGQEMMARAGFDPRQSIALWQLMGKQDKDAPPELLSTHPADGTRLRGLNAHLQKAWPLYEQALAAGKKPHCQR